jgi:hypothetical protein
MKISYIFLLIISSISTFGQGYHPLIRPNLKWQVMQGDGTQICNLSNGENYFLNGDTTILGTTYKKVSYNTIVPLNPGPYCPPFGINGSLIR